MRELDPGQFAVVHGGGPIGLAAFLGLRWLGVDVVVSEPSAVRRSIIAQLGGTAFDPGDPDLLELIRDRTNGLGADASIDAAGVAPAFRAAIELTRRRGTVVVVAVHGGQLPISDRDLLGEVDLRGSRLYGADFPHVVDAMAAGAFPTDGWVHTIGLDEVVADGLLALSEAKAMKILVDPSK